MPAAKGVDFKQSPISGKGVFAVKRFSPGDVLLSLERPLVAVLDKPHIDEVCSWCFLPGPLERSAAAGRSSRPPPNPINWCVGCRKVKYCSKSCQTQAWKSTHKYECKVFRAQPGPFPDAVTATYQILKGIQRGDSAFKDFLNLESHVDDVKRAGRERYDQLETLAYGAWKFAGEPVEPDEAIHLICMVLCNSLTLVTPTFDSLGLAVDPLASRVNHSCVPNCVVVFDGPRLVIRALEAVKAGEEITISYVDEHNTYGVRHVELKDRFHFDCSCPKCTLGPSARSEAFTKPPSALTPQAQTLGDKLYAGFVEVNDDWFPQHKLGESEYERRLSALQAMGDRALIDSERNDPKEALRNLGHCMEILQTCGVWPPARAPLPQLYHRYILACINCGHLSEAFKASLRRYFVIDPVVYDKWFHPARITHAWTLATLARLLSEAQIDHKDPYVARLQREGVNFQLLYIGLLIDIHELIPKSHGRNSTFAKMVNVPWRELMEPAEELMQENASMGLSEEQWHDQMRTSVRDAWPEIERVAKSYRIPSVKMDKA